MKLRTTLGLLLACLGAHACLGTRASSGPRAPNEIAARHFSNGRREVQKEEVCSVETSFPGLTRVSTIVHNGLCDGGIFVWHGEVFEDGRELARELLNRLDYAAKTPEQRASLALRVVSEVAFPSLPVSTSTFPPCTACERLSGYHVPRAHVKGDGGVSVELWHHFDDLTRYRVEVSGDGSLGIPVGIGRYKCSMKPPRAKNETEQRCALACSRASACDPTPPSEPTIPPLLEPGMIAHGTSHPAAFDPQNAKIMSRVQVCTNHCASAHLTAEDFECLADAHGTVFIGQSNTLPAQQCRTQRATDLAKTNDPTVLGAVLEPVVASAQDCEKAKTVNYAALKESMPSNLTAADIDRLHKYFWEDFERTQSVVTPGQRAGLESAIELTQSGRALKQAHRAAVGKAMSALNTQSLTSSCKAALAEAITKSGKQCDAGDAKPIDWLRAVGITACAPGTPP